MPDMKQKNDIVKLSFEQAIKELTSIVEKIEQGEIPLESSLQQYERGMALIAHCRTVLQKAEKRIEKISKEQDTNKHGQNADEHRPIQPSR